MKNLWMVAGLTVAGFAVAAAVIAKVGNDPAARPTGKSKHIVLIGASIGKSWNLSELPQRANRDDYTFEALQAWQYDKSEAVEETLMRPARRFRMTASYFKGFFQPSPQLADVVILKECSSYFGGDAQIAQKKEMFQRWVDEVRQKNLALMVATVAPITRERAARERNGVGKQAAIREFNDWMRAYATARGLALLDLEKALRADDTERYLRDEFTSGDGSHLSRAAYDVLDQVMLDALCQLDGGACRPTQARVN